MALTESYLVAVKNLPSFLEAIKAARAPERFTLRFLEDIGFKSTNDRLFIGILKALKFLDENSVPTQRYFHFLDDTQSARILADGVRDAYEDLFRINKKANTMSVSEIQGKLKSLTEGKKSEKVIVNMARTFVELSKLADFSEGKGVHDHPKAIVTTQTESLPKKHTESVIAPSPQVTLPEKEAVHPIIPTDRLIDAMTYRIEIVLPPVRDKAVYDAIFRSLKEHLL